MAVPAALATLIGFACGQSPVMASDLAGSGIVTCEASPKAAARPELACHGAPDGPTSQPPGPREASGATARSAALDRADGVASQALRLSLEQALVDDASGQPVEARKRYDVLKGTPLEAMAAIPSAVNLVVLDRLDEAQPAFSALSGSADLRTAGYAQIWQLWITLRTHRSDPGALRERMAQATVGLRAADAFQQAVLNLYAGQGSVDAVFAAADGATLPGSAQRRDARTEAAVFAGAYLQYVARDPVTAQRLYRRELPQSSGSLERPVLQQLIADP